MRPEIYWITHVEQGRLAIMPHPRGYEWMEDEITVFKQIGVDVIVSFLTPQEENDLGLQQEQNVCEAKGIEYLSFPITDRHVPDSIIATCHLISNLYMRLMDRKSIALHCRSGIGRSGIIAACILIKAGIATESVFDIISQARNMKIPDTQEQKDWIAQHKETLQRSEIFKNVL